ncbi:MAG: Acyl-(Acyl-carrier-protein)--phospholipid O-acyltransferase [Thermodesulfobacterium commune]|uniref:Bifunctional acyl-ACP--phospholipid O-acyltransferase/long-chain-fatty-acid--ACP ligase n=1 Tax=Thermodesulfobacterium commune TaxID=1741 RepID=A0A101FJU0_9BACT|nr:MAG: Acyl-(Acyl-carrier-protein)--phospholipid O-acyltransferase [Thermodesulfobacterium commune]HAA83217.1 bifunctional acyl-ACP--phospholipid O-acyltransferase/long-chain-fatty-acid--ACP ligase [Thermodesulfobacterium commune]HCE79763.1 bifunctional acyl-ACP--phospholipid O-acyltransferase/long-chain-fatty-acid--ACP ligase [Thermodesulfobacterium commune]
MQLHEKFIYTAKAYSNKIAIVDRAIDKRFTYQQALIASLIFSRKIRKFRDRLIGVMLPNSSAAVFTVVGILMAGKIPVMINYSTGPEYNIRYAREKCSFKTVVTSKKLLERVNCPVLEDMAFVEDWIEEIDLKEKLISSAISRLPLKFLMTYCNIDEDAEKTAVILFTSGSEKDPKAVELSHKNILSNIEGFSEMAKLTEKDIILSILPFFHVFGITVNLWTPLYHGMTFITYQTPLEYQKICQIIKEERPTVMAATPSFWWGYLKKAEPGTFDSLRLMVSGADKCPQSLRDAMWEKHRKILLEGYGTTETSPAISANMPDANKPGSVGKPLPNVEVMIENYETGERCGPNEIGRILVKGPNVMKGYYNDLEETSMRIRHGWYDTGDMGYLDEDGYLWHVGRLKRFVKIGGEMISLVKVEEELEKVLPKEIECCVVEVPDEIKGAKIVAVVSQKIDEKSVVKQLAKVLPNLAMPKQFLIIEELPKMGSGKINFSKVQEMVIERLKLKG